ncbi:MAG: hypothetical protein IT167_17245 [Bryobacterales bacterium]|nr:hypothetical protein [Bryobacterales bacterium]
MIPRLADVRIRGVRYPGSRFDCRVTIFQFLSIFTHAAGMIKPAGS